MVAASIREQTSESLSVHEAWRIHSMWLFGISCRTVFQKQPTVCTRCSLFSSVRFCPTNSDARWHFDPLEITQNQIAIPTIRIFSLNNRRIRAESTMSICVFQFVSSLAAFTHSGCIQKLQRVIFSHHRSADVECWCTKHSISMCECLLFSAFVSLLWIIVAFIRIKLIDVLFNTRFVCAQPKHLHKHDGFWLIKSWHISKHSCVCMDCKLLWIWACMHLNRWQPFFPIYNFSYWNLSFQCIVMKFLHIHTLTNIFNNKFEFKFTLHWNQHAIRNVQLN